MFLWFLCKIFPVCVPSLFFFSHYLSKNRKKVWSKHLASCWNALWRITNRTNIHPYSLTAFQVTLSLTLKMNLLPGRGLVSPLDGEIKMLSSVKCLKCTWSPLLRALLRIQERDLLIAQREFFPPHHLLRACLPILCLSLCVCVQICLFILIILWVSGWGNFSLRRNFYIFSMDLLGPSEITQNIIKQVKSCVPHIV